VATSVTVQTQWRATLIQLVPFESYPRHGKAVVIRFSDTRSALRRRLIHAPEGSTRTKC